MAKITPCEAGYACPYCRQVDASHTISLLPQCPIVWMSENEVYDTLTGERMPFVARSQPIQREDDDRVLLLPKFETRPGGRKVQVGLYRL